MRYKAVIFDMDGTILDTLADLYASVNAAMRWAGAPERTVDEVRRFVGNGAYKLIERSLPAGTPVKRVQEVLSFYKPYYETHAQIETKPYPGVSEALAELRRAGVLLAVASNKPDGAVKLLADRYFPGLFHAALGERPGLRVKPAPDLLLTAMGLLHAEPDGTVYVGDSEADIDTAKNAGVACVSAGWGFRDEAVLREHGAALVAADVPALMDAVRGGIPPIR